MQEWGSQFERLGRRRGSAPATRPAALTPSSKLSWAPFILARKETAVPTTPKYVPSVVGAKDAASAQSPGISWKCLPLGTWHLIVSF